MARPSDEPDLTLQVDENGEVHITSKALLRRLATTAGRWRLVPSVADLLVWQRVRDGAADDDVPPNAVMLSGVIDAPGALANILNFIQFSSIDGSLAIHAGAVRKTLYFRRGQLLAATSNLPEDRLGALLVRFGLLKEDDLVDCVREITPTRRLGTVLVDKGLMTSHDLYEGVRRQAEEIFYSTLLFRRGAYYLSRLADDAPIPVRLHLDTQGLLLEGLRRIDEMSYFRAKVPSPDVVLFRRGPPSAELEGEARVVYEQVNDTRTLREIGVLTRLGEFLATKAAFELVQSGVVEVRKVSDLRRQKPIRVAELPDDAVGTIIAAYNGALAKLYATMSAKDKAPSLRQGVAAFLAGSARYGDLFRDVGLGDDGTLPAERLATNVEALPGDARVEHLQRGLNELLFFVLFVAGDAIERSEEQELHERVAKALERLPKAGV